MAKIRLLLGIVFLGGFVALLLYVSRPTGAPRSSPVSAKITFSENRGTGAASFPTKKAGGKEQATGGKAAAPTAANSKQCGDCHSAIYKEWRSDEHSTAWTGEHFRTFTIEREREYGRVECLSCHAPKPILEVGLDKKAEVRETERADGVGCLSCHVKNGESYGPNGSGGPCGGKVEPALKTSQACWPCHSTHNLFKEYEASKYPGEGVTCQDCHMDRIKAPAVDGKPARERRSHYIRGGHDLRTLKEAVKLYVSVKGGTATVKVTNVGAGHGVPGEINNRNMVCEVAVENDKRQVLREYKIIFRAPPRLLRNKIRSLQLMPGESRIKQYPLNTRHGKVTAVLKYTLEAAATVKTEYVEISRKEVGF